MQTARSTARPPAGGTDNFGTIFKITTGGKRSADLQFCRRHGNYFSGRRRDRIRRHVLRHDDHCGVRGQRRASSARSTPSPALSRRLRSTRSARLRGWQALRHDAARRPKPVQQRLRHDLRRHARRLGSNPLQIPRRPRRPRPARQPDQRKRHALRHNVVRRRARRGQCLQDQPVRQQRACSTVLPAATTARTPPEICSYANGTLYGAARYNGVKAQGTVFSVSLKTGKFTLLHGFLGNPKTADRPTADSSSDQRHALRHDRDRRPRR